MPPPGEGDIVMVGAARAGGRPRAASPAAPAARRAYPQVEPGAAGIVDAGAVAVPPAARVGEALALARRRQAALVVAGEGVWVLGDDLARASLLGLDALPARVLARRLPALPARASEIAVRRRLAEGAPLVVVVGDRRRVVGAVSRRVLAEPAPAPLPPRLTAGLDGRARDLLGAIGRLATARGGRAFLVGGLVRDLLRGAAVDARDLDVVVEGDGLGLARALAAALGLPERAVTEHERFLTASVAVAGGRVDVATARAERYGRPGALPRVVPAPIAQDLGRRDFTVNAMAIELGTDRLGLLDPFGGRADLRRRRLRVLHPLSFVEDPTRLFRAARYAARLGFRLDGWTARAQRLAVRLGAFPALSGQRLLAEIDLILADVRPEAALRRLGTAGAFRLLDPRYRFRRTTAARLDALAAARGWAERHGLRVPPLELALLVLLGDQRPAVRAAALRRLGLTGEPLERIETALDAAAGGPPAAGRPSARARWLRARSDLALAWLWLTGGPAARAMLDWYATEAREVRPALRGDDVLALGVPPGPAVARVLAALRDARLDGRVTDREGEQACVRHWLEREEEG